MWQAAVTQAPVDSGEPYRVAARPAKLCYKCRINLTDSTGFSFFHSTQCASSIFDTILTIEHHERLERPIR
jgi:hypothetical protein